MKINVSPAAREVTDHYAAGAFARAYERASIIAGLPAYIARMGGLPRYDEVGKPANSAAVLATTARAARLEARRIAAEASRAAAKGERIARAAVLAETYAAEIEAAEIESDMTAEEFSAALAMA
jgi:hypothetical protein